MIYSIQSNNEDYSVLRANINIPWNCNLIKYYISSINTKANILVSTNDDEIVFQNHSNLRVIEFQDRYNITIDDIINLFPKNDDFISIEYDLNKRVFKITAPNGATLSSITHRASLLLGLYNVKAPLTINAGTYYCPDVPILDYANKFYLVSLQGKALSTTIHGEEYTPSIIANIDTFYKDNLPMLINFDIMSKPIKIKVNTDGLKYLEMRLVDFLFQPIVIRSPVFVTLKIKPANKH